MTAYRFVHAADIHLDSPLRSLALRDPALAEFIGNATRQVFTRIIDLCIEEKVQALLLAGDLYDGDQTSMKTARFLGEQLRRLDAAGIDVFIIRGNHDALSRITKELVFPPNVHLFGGRAEAVEIERDRGERLVAIHGLSFAKPHAPEGLLSKYRPPVQDATNIGLMHTSLGGSPSHDVYAPCSTSDLLGSGFRYWALGHIHKRSTIEGSCAIVMPGIPQGRDIGESGPKSVTLASVLDDGSITLEERIVSLAQFEWVILDASGTATWHDLVARLDTSLEDAATRSVSDHLVVRLAFSGTTPLAWNMRRDADLLRTEAETRAKSLGDVWIDKLEIDCRRTQSGATASTDQLDALRKTMNDEVAASEGFQNEATDTVKELLAQLPPECRRAIAPDEAALENLVARLAVEGAEEVLARLSIGDSDGAR
ncbi:MULTISPECIES: metallophosphoesterase family protein [Bradyrhizobium]|uniref:metallophosphoesterase family protein n=1 Tax=Bradyrhizobium TaxID=374 RepID=UPI0004AFF67F|nr:MULTISPECIES: DNA repair exonuclease [Bradyrhizobium]MBR1366853.1 DNA repair exonuclease [Bradyrhizobium ottawaense]MDA9415564.1 serine/threonine protein phosphatase [Bradyrhizobium sp. CCBAU 25360]MDA9456585.1 serine/threonine protein phosphatase [Bradyrhizobium sp. CCBAU 21359]MDA9515459.1 serine/threonine protein phosphatase [Bradyrhizobium sp. CCBAU 11430]